MKTKYKKLNNNVLQDNLRDYIPRFSKNWEWWGETLLARSLIIKIHILVWQRYHMQSPWTNDWFEKNNGNVGDKICEENISRILYKWQAKTNYPLITSQVI